MIGPARGHCGAAVGVRRALVALAFDASWIRGGAIRVHVALNATERDVAELAHVAIVGAVHAAHSKATAGSFRSTTRTDQNETC